MTLIATASRSREAKKEALVAVALFNDFVDPLNTVPPFKTHSVAVFLVDKDIDLGEYSPFLTGPLGRESRLGFYKFRFGLCHFNPKLEEIYKQNPEKDILLVGVRKFLTWVPVLNDPKRYYIVRTVL